MTRTQSLLRYFCSECNTLLRETDRPIDRMITSSEECPKCGCQISKSLKRVTAQQYDCNRTGSLLFRPKFQSASGLCFDIEKLDSILKFGIGQCICVVGKHSKILVERLYINALLPERHGGFGSSNVIIIDGANSSDVYQCVNFARQYGLDIRNIMSRIIVSRPFTIYQLANLVINELPHVMQKYDTKTIIISDILRMFLDDPQVKFGEGRRLIKAITNTIRQFSTNTSVIVSCYREPPSEYSRILFPNFDKCIQITNSEVKETVRIEVKNRKKEGSRIIQLQQRELEIVARK